MVHASVEIKEHFHSIYNIRDAINHRPCGRGFIRFLHA